MDKRVLGLALGGAAHLGSLAVLAPGCVGTLSHPVDDAATAALDADTTRADARVVDAFFEADREPADPSRDARVDPPLDASFESERDATLADDAGMASDPCRGASVGPMRLVANLETIGVTAEVSSSGSARVFVRGPDGRWREGYTPVSPRPGLVATSLFGLLPDTRYTVRLEVGSEVFCGDTTTQPREPRFETRRTLHVRAGASGGDGSRGRPFGSIREAAAVAAPGDLVQVAAGVYHESVDVRRGGIPGAPVRFVGEAGAVLDGSVALTGFRSEGGGVYSVPVAVRATNMARGDGRFYGFRDLDALRAGGPLGTCDDGETLAEGWTYDAGRVDVRTASSPMSHVYRYPVLRHAFSIAADHVHVEGFELRRFGAEEGATIHVAGSHVVIRRNAFVGGNDGVLVRAEGTLLADDVRIEDNTFTDAPTYDFPWCAVKTTDMEVSAIVLDGGTGAIVRGNRIRDFFNGVYTGRWPVPTDERIAFDVDVYDNDLARIGDDGFEPEGPSINQRFRNNRFVGGLVGVSLAPVRTGPTFVLRNLIVGFRGTSFKWGNGSTGVILIAHNTSVSAAESGIAGLTYYERGDRTTYLNNVFSSTWRLLRNRYGGDGNQLDYDLWHTTHRDPVFVWGSDDRVFSREELCDAFGFECHGLVAEPRFTNAPAGDYTPSASSPAVDRGIVIPGINEDFLGTAPDLGAFERGR